MRADYIGQDMLGHVLAALMPANALALEVSAHTGLRIGDVLALKTADLKRRMYVREEKSEKKVEERRKREKRPLHYGSLTGFDVSGDSRARMRRPYSGGG